MQVWHVSCSRLKRTSGTTCPEGLGTDRTSSTQHMLMRCTTGCTSCHCLTEHILRAAFSWVALSKMHSSPAIALTGGIDTQSLVGSRLPRALPGTAPRGSASPALATLARLIAPMACPPLPVCCVPHCVALDRRCFSRLCHHPHRCLQHLLMDMIEICLSILGRSSLPLFIAYKRKQPAHMRRFQHPLCF